MIEHGQLSAAAHAAVLEWLRLIGENDLDKINHTLERCAARPGVLVWIRGEALLIKLEARGASVIRDGDKLLWGISGWPPDKATRQWFVDHEQQIIAALKIREGMYQNFQPVPYETQLN